MDLRSFFSRSSDLEPGNTIEVLDDSGEVALATYKGKGKHTRGHVVVTYTQGRYTGIDQYVARERVVGLVGKKAEPVLAHHEGWNQMKEVRKHITATVLLTLATVGSASLYAGIVLAMSNNRAIAVLVFFAVFAFELPLAARWLRKQVARQKQGTNLIPEALMIVHEFIAHVKMHPELLLAGTTEFDLERFRKQWDGSNQAALKAWIKQFSGETTSTSQFR